MTAARPRAFAIRCSAPLCGCVCWCVKVVLTRGVPSFSYFITRFSNPESVNGSSQVLYCAAHRGGISLGEESVAANAREEEESERAVRFCSRCDNNEAGECANNAVTPKWMVDGRGSPTRQPMWGLLDRPMESWRARVRCCRSDDRKCVASESWTARSEWTDLR